eukprot:CAMPEP_0206610738 /NCGR_PEP_ID=MMETSP0325_2-20121206/54753_1 /ASSEMBLY_ACC=CAM_ASM_000347 /TAXON_ID=2866 /ORGANISM="Crypthecodinium cohnii, Strain Seligo" /LENGTH=60 /DNA_ID=CAMNT_0054129657 /DNA_START=51 /DNA_END=230 /DNA_ORIENTATION=+
MAGNCEIGGSCKLRKRDGNRQPLQQHVPWQHEQAVPGQDAPNPSDRGGRDARRNAGHAGV